MITASGDRDPWHSINSDDDVYHNNSKCNLGRGIRPERLKYGTGGRQLCQRCRALNKDLTLIKCAHQAASAASNVAMNPIALERAYRGWSIVQPYVAVNPTASQLAYRGWSIVQSSKVGRF